MYYQLIYISLKVCLSFAVVQSYAFKYEAKTRELKILLTGKSESSFFIQRKIIKLFSNNIKCKMIAFWGGGRLINISSIENDFHFVAGGTYAAAYLVTWLQFLIFINSRFPVDVDLSCFSTSSQSIIFLKTTSALLFHSHFIKEDYFIIGFQEAFVVTGTDPVPYMIYNSLHLRLHSLPHPTFPWSFLSKPMRLRFCSLCSKIQKGWIMFWRENLVFVRDVHIKETNCKIHKCIQNIQKACYKTRGQLHRIYEPECPVTLAKWRVL